MFQVWELENSAVPLVLSEANADRTLVGSDATPWTWEIARLPLMFVQVLLAVGSNRHNPPSFPKRISFPASTIVCWDTCGPTLLVEEISVQLVPPLVVTKICPACVNGLSDVPPKYTVFAFTA